MDRASFLDEGGFGPRFVFESSFEVAAANKKQLRVDSHAVKGAAVELGHGTRTGPFVGGDDHTHPH